MSLLLESGKDPPSLGMAAIPPLYFVIDCRLDGYSIKLPSASYKKQSRSISLPVLSSIFSKSTSSINEYNSNQTAGSEGAAAYLRSEYKYWGDAVKASGVKLEQ